MADNKAPPIIYLDANIIISFIETQEDTICELVRLCNKHNIKMYISPFALMETLDIKQEHKYFTKKVEDGIPIKNVISQRLKRDLSKEELTKIMKGINRKLKLQNLDEYTYPKDANWWKTALNIVADSNVTSSDALHLGQALNMDVRLLVTNDNDFVKDGNEYLKQISKEKKLMLVSPELALNTVKSVFGE